jgi:hypothetical protein
MGITWAYTVLRLLANNGSKMELSRSRASTGMRYALLLLILEELAKEGRIGIFGEMATLILYEK